MEKSGRFGERYYLTNEEQILLERRVIETTNFSEKSSFGHNRSRINIERFTRISEHKMLYSPTAAQPDT